MKRKIAILLTVCLAFLPACRGAGETGEPCTDEKNGVSLIAENGEGAFGNKTSEQSSGNKETEAEQEMLPETAGETHESYPVRMFRLDGELYYDTGEASKMTPRCGTLDGHFESLCGNNEIPTEDGMANFKPTNDYSGGWQSASENTKEVPIGGEWIIFRKLETDIGDNKLCERIAGESEALRFYGGDKSDNIYVPVEYGRLYNWGITLSAKDISSSGMTMVISQSGGSPAGELQTGTWYSLEKHNGKFWEELPYILDEETVAWTMVAYPIPKDSERELRCDWELLYGELSAGKYRISKEIMDFRAAGEYDEHVYCLEFEITE